MQINNQNKMHMCGVFLPVSYTDSYSMLASLISPTAFLKTRVAYTKLFHQNLFIQLCI